MSMLHNTSSHFAPSAAIRSSLAAIGAWLDRAINNWIARVIAQREQQASLAILRHFNDRELADIGLNRNQIGEGLTEAARVRSEQQRYHLRSIA